MSEENKKPPSFEVDFTRSAKRYVTTDTEAFDFGVGQAGELMIFRTEYHKTFDAAISKHVRIECYAPGKWICVKVLPDEEA